MGKLADNKLGFSTVEVLLALILVAIIAFIGVYVAHNNKPASSTVPAPAKSQKITPAKLTLAQAVTQSQAVYDAYEKDVLDGQVLQEISAWAKNNVPAAEDLQFINAHKTLFTPSFVNAANQYQATNTSPLNDNFIECSNGYYNNGSTKVVGDSLDGQTAMSTVSFTAAGQATVR